MKMRAKLLNLLGLLTVGGGLAAGQPLYAGEPADFTKTLAGTSIVEMPAKAADLVGKAAAADRQNTAIAVVKAAIGLNPSAAAVIVSAVARQNPSVAPVAAVTAATLQHKLIDRITKAVVAAAPAEAAKIVAALIKAFPKDYALIAVAATEAAPSAGREILAVVGDDFPALKTGIQAAIANFAANSNVPVQAILNQSYTQFSNAGVAAAGGGNQNITQTVPGAFSASLSPPVFGPPFTPLPPTFIIYNPGELVPEKPGGRNYVSP
jgi:hypothetical protein